MHALMKKSLRLDFYDKYMHVTCFLLPNPPNFGQSLQLIHFSQFGALHPLHSVHLNALDIEYTSLSAANP